MSKHNLGWGSRLALIDHYGASDDIAAAAFNVSIDEIETARNLRRDGGAANMPIDIDVKEYGNPFENVKGVTSIRMPRKREPAETATRVESTPKKRGRKGTKIHEAFKAIGTDPIPAEQFAEECSVSLNVLRQAKRFDRTGLGKVHVKRIDGTLMVYREGE